jgi:hypothetical protein
MEYKGSQILKVHANLLREFWSNHGRRRKNSDTYWWEVIADMQRLGTVKIIYSNPKLTLEKRRREFDKWKNIRNRYRFNKGDRCFACGEQAQVRHHLIWLKNGGRNNKRNICFLCHRCHSEVHPWLKNS